MKILIVMDPGISIPVVGYGGHERLVEMLALEYTSLGHDVSLLVTEGSYLKDCTVYSLGKKGFPPPKSDRLKTMFTAWKFLWKHRNDFDVVHNFGRLIYLLPILNSKVHKIMTYGRIIRGRNIKYINLLPNKNLIFTAPSIWCVNTGNASGKWAPIYNSIDFSKYTPTSNLAKDAPLIFLSRLEKLKGAHEAIQVALATKNKLIIAGNISTYPEEIEYFKKEIEPFIDGVQIEYVGTLDDVGKNKYLGMAKAMLFPARTDEAFGMVMAEAMACGTPVIAYNHSAMPEVVTDGSTGFIVTMQNEIADAIIAIDKLDRVEVRKISEAKFDVKEIAKQYLNLIFK
jgi:glycosyltransferase involved in cell wall biosynthesis